MSIAFTAGTVVGAGLMGTVIPSWAGGFFERRRPSTLRILLGVALSGLLTAGGAYGGTPGWLAASCFLATVILAVMAARRARMSAPTIKGDI